MDIKIKEEFLRRWKKYFNGADLPITFYYSDREDRAERAAPASATVHRCFIGDLARVRKGKSISFDIDSVGCGGGRKYLGFLPEVPRPNFEYFLSCGIPGELEGERYKKSPELVRELMKRWPTFRAPGKFIVFKRWDDLTEEDDPQVVIFFARPDVLSGLFTLAGFDVPDPEGVFSPFSAGCGSIVQYPYLEKDSESPRAVLGMFDVSARPFVPDDMLTFAVPFNKFAKMIGYMDESFLITPSWEKVKKRIK